MKTRFNTILILAALGVFTMLLAGNSRQPVSAKVYSYQATPHLGWTNIRTIDSNDTVPDVATDPNVFKWANMPSHKRNFAEYLNAPKFRVRFSDGDGTTAKIYIFTCAEGDDAEPFAFVFATAGKQAATLGGTYADTLSAIATDRWYKTVGLIDAGGNNGMSKIIGDGCGGKYWIVYVDEISSGSVSIDIGGI